LYFLLKIFLPKTPKMTKTKAKILVLLAVFLLAKTSNSPAQTRWWQHNNLRVIQLNLPDYEAATLNPDSVVANLLSYSANTLIINAGGIMAFYHTKTPNHYQNPYAKDGVLASIIEKCHQHHIKVMVRFDFSRADKSVYDQHPDWFYISAKGERMVNTNKYAVTINAPYLQEVAFQIVTEVMDRFPIDGIFQNMPGYQTRNVYENTYLGIDQNPYDKAAFYQYAHLPLPIAENKEDSVFRKYEEFKTHSTNAWQKKLYELVKAKNPNIAICTYADRYVDIIRHESQTNSLPYWPYSASDNVANASGSYPSHTISNASIQQVSFQSRYNAVEPEETEIRLWENIANGSGLDMSMMGDMQGYQDTRNFPVFKKIYTFHKNNEKYYGQYSSLAKILLISPGDWPAGNPMQEYRGIQLMLKETHLQYDIISETQIENRAAALANYRTIIVPDIANMTPQAIVQLQKISEKGTHIIATNGSFSNNSLALRQLFGAQVHNKDYEGTGNYLEVDKPEIFKRLHGQTMINWKYNLGQYIFDQNVLTYMPILAKGRPGPPELIGGHDRTGFYAIGCNKYYKSTNVLLPINIGRLYYLNGYEQHKNILLDILQHIEPQLFTQITTNAHPRVELILKAFRYNNNQPQTRAAGKIVHFINLTGFSGNTYFEPHKINNIEVKINNTNIVKKAYRLSDKKPIPFSQKNGYLQITLPKLDAYEAVVLEE
jgi:hypothetical protein